MGSRWALKPRDCIALVIALTVAIQPRAVEAQVSAEREIRGGEGSALVRNASRSDVDVEVALWESDETGPRVELLDRANVAVWPTEFHLRPGETQTVRFLLSTDTYPSNTLLRLETRFTPTETAPIPATAGTSGARGAEARLRVVTRLITKVWIR